MLNCNLPPQLRHVKLCREANKHGYWGLEGVRVFRGRGVKDFASCPKGLGTAYTVSSVASLSGAGAGVNGAACTFRGLGIEEMVGDEALRVWEAERRGRLVGHLVGTQRVQIALTRAPISSATLGGRTERGLRLMVRPFVWITSKSMCVRPVPASTYPSPHKSAMLQKCG